VKRLLTIGFALSGLLLIAWPFDVFAMLHGISPHIQLANGHVFHEEPTDFSFLAFFLYPGVWGVSLVLARRAIKEPVRKTRAMIWTLVPFAWMVVLGYTGNAVRYAKEEEWVRKDRKIGLLQDRISASNLSLSEREAAFQAVVEYVDDPDRSVQHYAFGALGRSAAAMPEQDKETAVRILIEGLGNAHPEDCVNCSHASRSQLDPLARQVSWLERRS
jgi:hypothetical protein